MAGAELRKPLPSACLEALQAKCTLEIPSLGVKVPFDGEIKLK